MSKTSKERLAYIKDWQKRNKEKTLEAGRRYRKTDKYKMFLKEYYLKHKHRFILAREKYKNKDPEHYKEVVSNYSKIWRENNKDKVIEYNRKANKKYFHSYSGKNKALCRRQTKQYLLSVGINYKEQNCEVNGCYNKTDHVHHWNYNNYLDISFLCKKHHTLLHNNDENIINNIKRSFLFDC